MPPQNYYAVLGVSRKADQVEIRRAFLGKVKQYHPDVNNAPGATAMMVEVNEAYEVLSDDKKRKAYDRLISVSATTTGRAGTHRPSSSGPSRARQEAEQKAQEAAWRQREREAEERRAAERHEQEARRKQEQQEKAKRDAEEQARQERERAKLSKIGVNTVDGLAAKRRQKPYIFVSGLAKLMAGRSCEWDAWFKTQHEGSSWEKAPSDFDSVKWELEHNALLQQEMDVLKDAGSPLLSYQKFFTLNLGKSDLGIKPDLVYVDRNGVLTVQDCRTGQLRDEHRNQIMLCMWALPLVDSLYSGRPIQGRVVYPKYDHIETVTAAEINDNFVNRAKTLIDRLADGNGAFRFPSPSECRFCDIPRNICEDRIGN